MNHKHFLQRLFHANSVLRSTSNKNNLAKLRKKTGYTFSNCKKALEVNNNDIALAEKWLKEQAQALGWSKATKLEGRSTLQGLIGLTMTNESSLLMEINCETDFVARNKSFTSFVEMSVDNCLKHFKQHPECNSLIKINLDNKDLKAIIGPESKTLADHTALIISKLGENINLRRATYIKTPANIYLSGYTHPTPEKMAAKVYTGKYGSLIAYTTATNDNTVQHVARQICQHIVGMNPTKIGIHGEDEPLENKDEESVMIHQDFLIDPSITVGQLIQDVGINIVDFIRFECGEQIEEVVDPVKVGQRA
uniref:Elongation factor Ts, mitochondrial n=1 Tax=Triatoma dimidiata TaxID=72491 RepID=A0A0V0G8V0_TRIDM